MKLNLLLIVFTAAALSALAQTPADKAGLSKNELRKLFEDTQWVTMNGARTFIFHRGGKLIDSSSNVGNYTLEAPDILKMYRGDPARNRKAEFMFFRVNAGAKTAQQDGQAGTMGGNNFLKYDGPAKRVK